MSTAITVYDNEDMPCEDWKDSPAEKKSCPMQEKWHEGEVRMCPECAWKIAYNCEEE